MDSEMVDLRKLKELTKDMCVLYVEDDKVVREEIEEFLKKFFLVVDLADNGENGLKCYRDGNYDLVISDINMPKMNGIEMSKAIFDEAPNQPIIINSAYNNSEYLLELINSGIEYYVLKPINLQQLARVIYKVAESRYNKKAAELYHATINRKNIKLEKTLEEKNDVIKSQVYRDNLTGLDNLCACMHSIRENYLKKTNFTVLILLDIDSLQDINDIYSTDSGNTVIVGFSEFLKNFAHGKSYEVYRTAGDQFVLLDQVAFIDTDKYEKEFTDLQEEIKKFSVYLSDVDKELNINATIGMSLGQEFPLEHADMALKNAKENHKSYAVYNSLIDTTQEMKLKIEWSYKINKAIENNHFIPVFQPIVDKDGSVVKHESLMRMIVLEDGKETLVSPDDFLEIAFENKYYMQISGIIINKAIDFLKVHSGVISINLAYSDIENKSFMNTLYKRIAEENIGDRLIIEITENENIRDYQVLKNSIIKFRGLGVKIAIDDFGSSYANFNHILEMHPEYVKIDGTLVKNIDTDSHAYILTKAITTFCHELGIKVIAEFVHSKEIFDILKRFKVDEFQGYYFSEPLRKIT